MGKQLAKNDRSGAAIAAAPMLSDRHILSRRAAGGLRARRQGQLRGCDLPAGQLLCPSERQNENWPPGCLGASLSNGSVGVPRCGVKSGAPGAASPAIICHPHEKRQRRTGVSKSALQPFRASAQLRGNGRYGELRRGKTRRRSNAEPLRHVIGRPERTTPLGKTLEKDGRSPTGRRHPSHGFNAAPACAAGGGGPVGMLPPTAGPAQGVWPWPPSRAGAGRLALTG